MRLPFSKKDDETVLKEFTEDYSEYKTIEKISKGRLKHWTRSTKNTEGRYISEYMSPKLWGDSLESLNTAQAILLSYVPKDSEAARTKSGFVLAAVRREILKRKIQKEPPLVLKKKR